MSYLSHVKDLGVGFAVVGALLLVWKFLAWLTGQFWFMQALSMLATAAVWLALIGVVGHVVRGFL